MKFAKSKVASITQDATGKPMCNGAGTESYNRNANAHNLVILAIGMEPSVNANDFPVDIVVNREGYTESDPANGGMVVAGLASDALDMNRAYSTPRARPCGPSEPPTESLVRSAGPMAFALEKLFKKAAGGPIDCPSDGMEMQSVAFVTGPVHRNDRHPLFGLPNGRRSLSAPDQLHLRY